MFFSCQDLHIYNIATYVCSSICGPFEHYRSLCTWIKIQNADVELHIVLKVCTDAYASMLTKEDIVRLIKSALKKIHSHNEYLDMCSWKQDNRDWFRHTQLSKCQNEELAFLHNNMATQMPLDVNHSTPCTFSFACKLSIASNSRATLTFSLTRRKQS